MLGRVVVTLLGPKLGLTWIRSARDLDCDLNYIYGVNSDMELIAPHPRHGHHAWQERCVRYHIPDMIDSVVCLSRCHSTRKLNQFLPFGLTLSCSRPTVTVRNHLSHPSL